MKTSPGGCECIAHTIQAMTDANPRCTVLSVDGIGEYDTISRRAMLSGLVRHMEGGDSFLPFVLQFYGSPSSYLWEDSAGVVHKVWQGEGGEQGDALMPALFSLGQHDALVAIQRRLGLDERLLAFLDDIYAVGGPARAHSSSLHCNPRGIEDPHWHRGASGEDTVVESGRSHTSRQRSSDSSGTSGRSHCHCVEGRSTPPSRRTRCQDSRNTSGPPKIREHPVGSAQQNLTSSGSAVCLDLAAVLRFGTRKLHVAGGASEVDRCICGAPRCLNAASSESARVSGSQFNILGCCKSSFHQRWHGVAQRRPDLSSRVLVQLGGLSRDDFRPKSRCGRPDCFRFGAGGCRVPCAWGITST